MIVHNSSSFNSSYLYFDSFNSYLSKNYISSKKEWIFSSIFKY
jgi:hypothetical protein